MMWLRSASGSLVWGEEGEALLELRLAWIVRSGTVPGLYVKAIEVVARAARQIASPIVIGATDPYGAWVFSVFETGDIQPDYD